MGSIANRLKSFIKKNTPAKKCMICEKRTAAFCIKGSRSSCYCSDCAKEHFSDLDLLEKL